MNPSQDIRPRSLAPFARQSPFPVSCLVGTTIGEVSLGLSIFFKISLVHREKKEKHDRKQVLGHDRE